MQASNLAQAGHAFFALTHSMNMHGRAAAMVTPIGDKKTLLPAESAVSSSGCAGRGRVKRAARERTNGSTQGCRERSDAKVCASASVAEGPSATFVDFLRCTKSDLGTIGDGAPPQDVWHRLWSLYTPGSPPTKFGRFVTVCNRHIAPYRAAFHLVASLYGEPPHRPDV